MQKLHSLSEHRFSYAYSLFRWRQDDIKVVLSIENSLCTTNVTIQCNAMGHTLHLVLKAVLLVSQFILHPNACSSHRLNFMKIYWIHLLNIVAWNILIQGRKGDIILIHIVSSSLKIELNCIVLDNRQW